MKPSQIRNRVNKGLGRFASPNQMRMQANSGLMSRSHRRGGNRPRDLMPGGIVPAKPGVPVIPIPKQPINRRGRTMGGSCPPGMHMMPGGRCMMGEYHGAPGSGTGGGNAYDPGQCVPSCPDHQHCFNGTCMGGQGGFRMTKAERGRPLPGYDTTHW